MVRPGRIPFFVTETGQRLVFYGSTTLAIGLFAGHYLPNTVGIEYLRDFFQAYKNGQEQKPSEKLQQRFDRAIRLLKLTDFEQKFVKPFMVCGFDIFNAGSLKSRNGGIVGIPANFEYDSAADIEKSDVVLHGRKIDWNSEAGKLLEDCLVLNEDEQVFAMAREILTLNSHKLLLQSVIPSIMWVFTYSVAHLINRRNNLYIRPFSLRCMLYAICGTFGYGLYSFSMDMSEMHFETTVDKRLAELGPDVADAGARFYDKILKKNIAMRKLTGDNYYTAKGNINYLLRQKAAPLTLRKAFFVSGYKSNTSSQESS
ncbi:transmembrane protein 177 [Topomyia yanbarensis]|uniref:transmembrane protein 177 n=1 Tax=Topomyia yanbarensis TaxID=2498891 RepID=UPI00273C079E|nr:transmembrane protein 177 [Topomyia yanbarensis]